VDRRRSEDPARKAGESTAVPVAIVNSRVEADLIVGMLRSNGVPAAVSADDAGGVEPPLQIGGVRVLVPRSDEVLARQLIAEAEAEA
jgi:Putative prokaryotic signal transducing protein